MTNEPEELRRRATELEAENQHLTDSWKQSREWFFKIFHAAANPMAITRLDNGLILDVNEAFVEFCGHTREELIGKTTSECGLWADPNQRDTAIRLLHERGKVNDFEVLVGTKSGEIFTALFSCDTITVNDEPCMLSMAVDITERIKAQNALRESEERFRLIAETIDEIFWIYDLKTERMLYVSPAHERIWGYAWDPNVDNRELNVNLIHPDDRERVETSVGGMKSGLVLDFEHRIIKPDGSVRHIWNRGYPVRAASGQIKQYVGVAQDVTAWRQAEDNLKESSEYLNAIINNIGDPIFVKDRGHKFVLINDAMCLFTARSRDELLGITGYELISKSQAARFWEQDESLFNTGAEQIAEEDIADGHGELHAILMRKALLDDSHGNKQIVGVMRDITEYKRLEAQFRQAQKMEAIGVLAGGIAHDFNNMLNVINGYSEIVIQDLPRDSPIRTDLEQIRAAGKRAASLTSQLLAFSRKQILCPELVNMGDILRTMSPMLRRIIGEDIELLTQVQPDLGLIHVDPGQMQQIVMNLAVNARDAMPKGGKLTIEIANIELDDRYASRHPAIKPGRYIMLAISDNGIGMDAETQSRIFEPFFTTKGKDKGTGLGLSTVYGIVKQSNGFIWVYSETGKGATFKIYFPRVEGESSGASSENGIESAIGGTETVLVVEDDSSLRALACRILRERGYQVLEAPNGKTGIKTARKHKGEIHLIVTDVVMPGMSGKELVEELKALRPGIKSLYVSGYTDNAIVHHGILDSNVYFLQKPFTVESLVRKVREVLNSGTEEG